MSNFVADDNFPVVYSTFVEMLCSAKSQIK